MQKEKAVFAAGCFWGVEEHFRLMPGVLSTRVGYTGGQTENPTYESVCRGDTAHAEALEIVFNPQEISFEKLAREFFSMHDPTTKDRQGPDVGSQYRSAVFVQNSEQETTIRSLIEELNKENYFNSPIVTEVNPDAPFWEAEAYHQCYLKKRNA